MQLQKVAMPQTVRGSEIMRLCHHICDLCVVFYSKLDIVSVSREEWLATPHANV